MNDTQGSLVTDLHRLYLPRVAIIHQALVVRER
jgi:hypothetical protein